MKIGIIGAGNIGATLGRKWAAAGHQLCYGVRDPQAEKYTGLKSSGRLATAGEAAAFGEVLVLAMPGAAVANFANEHASTLSGKLVIDATNNRSGPEMHSLGLLAEKAPAARLARAFSTLGWENFANPEQDGVQVDLFFCGDPAARGTCERLIAEIGLHPVYLGGVDAAAVLDGLTRAWFRAGLHPGLQPAHVFQATYR